MCDSVCGAPRAASPGEPASPPYAQSLSAAHLGPSWSSGPGPADALVVSDDDHDGNDDSREYERTVGGSDDEPQVVDVSSCASPNRIRSYSAQPRSTADAAGKPVPLSERSSPVLQLDSPDRSLLPLSRTSERLPRRDDCHLRSSIADLDQLRDQARDLYCDASSTSRDAEVHNSRTSQDLSTHARTTRMTHSPSSLYSMCQRTDEEEQAAPSSASGEPAALAALMDLASGISCSGSDSLMPPIAFHDRVSTPSPIPFGRGDAPEVSGGSDDVGPHALLHLDMDSVIDLSSDSTSSSEEDGSEAEDRSLPLPELSDDPASKSDQQSEDEDVPDQESFHDEEMRDGQLGASQRDYDPASDEPEEEPIAQGPFQLSSRQPTEEVDAETDASEHGSNDGETAHRAQSQDASMSEGKVLDVDAKLEWVSDSHLALRFRDGNLYGLGKAPEAAEEEAAKQVKVPALTTAWVHPQLAKDTALPPAKWSVDKDSDGQGWVEEMHLPLPRITTAAGIVTMPLAQVALGRSGIEVQVAIVARRMAPHEAPGFVPAQVPWRRDTFGQKWKPEQNLLDANFRTWRMLCLFTFNGRSAAVSSRVVSSMHVRLEATPTLVKVTDLGSTHGTVIAQGSDASLSLLEVKGSSNWRTSPVRVLLGRHRKSREGGIVHRRVEVSIAFELEAVPCQSSHVREIQSLGQCVANRRRRLLWRTWGQLRPARTTGSTGLPLWPRTMQSSKLRLPLPARPHAASLPVAQAQHHHWPSHGDQMPELTQLPPADAAPVAMSLNGSATDNDSSAPEEGSAQLRTNSLPEADTLATQKGPSTDADETEADGRTAPSGEELGGREEPAEAPAVEDQPTLTGADPAETSVTNEEADVTLVDPESPLPGAPSASLKRKREPEPSEDPAALTEGAPPAKRATRQRVRDMLLGGVVGAVATFTSLAALGASLE